MLTHLRLPWFASLLVALPVAGISLAACGGDGGDGPQEITIEVVEPYRFDPEVFQLEAGQPVRVTLDNTQGAEAHDFAVRDMPVEDGGVEVENAEHQERFAVYVLAEQGESQTTVEFVPSEAGEYYFFCNIPGHTQAGMIGIVRVR